MARTPARTLPGMNAFLRLVLARVAPAVRKALVRALLGLRK